MNLKRWMHNTNHSQWLLYRLYAWLHGNGGWWQQLQNKVEREAQHTENHAETATSTWICGWHVWLEQQHKMQLYLHLWMSDWAILLFLLQHLLQQQPPAPGRQQRHNTWPHSRNQHQRKSPPPASKQHPQRVQTHTSSHPWKEQAVGSQWTDTIHNTAKQPIQLRSGVSNSKLSSLTPDPVLPLTA